MDTLERMYQLVDETEMVVFYREGDRYTVAILDKNDEPIKASVCNLTLEEGFKNIMEEE